MKNLTEEILKIGVKNVIFLIPMSPVHTIMGISYTSSSDKKFIVPCKINEE